MLTVRNLYDWAPDTIDEFLEDKELFRLAKKEYAEEFKEFCDEYEDMQEEWTQEEKFKEFIGVELRDNEQGAFLRILEAFANHKGLKAAYCDAFVKGDDDLWTVYINQVVPLNKDDLKELIEVYVEETSGATEVSEVVADGLLAKIPG